MVFVGDFAMYLGLKTRTAQYCHPGDKAKDALPRTSAAKPEKVKKGAPVQYSIEPQPDDLPHPWEQMLLVPDVGKTVSVSHPPFRRYPSLGLRANHPSAGLESGPSDLYSRPCHLPPMSASLTC
jgi:hypothetical protein